MKKLRWIAALLPVGLLFMFGSSVSADDSMNSSSEVSEAFSAYLIDENTGEKENLDVEVLSNKKTESSATFNRDENSSSTYEAELQVFAPIDSNDNISPQADSGASETDGGVTATVNANYTLSANGDQIRVNSFNGSWQPSDTIYNVSNRVAGVHAGSFAGNGNHRYEFNPSSNSFSYTTGWGYNELVQGDLSPRAWAECTITVSAMPGSHNLVVETAFP